MFGIIKLDRNQKVVIGDLLVLITITTLPLTYIAPAMIAGDVGIFLTRAIAALGILSILSQFFWMLASAITSKNITYKIGWIVLIIFTYIIGSCIFYFEIYRPFLKSQEDQM